MASRTVKPLPPVPGASSTPRKPLAVPKADFATQLQERMRTRGEETARASPVSPRSHGSSAGNIKRSPKGQRFSMQQPLPAVPPPGKPKRHTMMENFDPPRPPPVSKPNGLRHSSAPFSDKHEKPVPVRSPPSAGLSKASQPPPPQAPPPAKKPVKAKPPPTKLKQSVDAMLPPPALKPSLNTYPTEDLYEGYDEECRPGYDEDFYETADDESVERAREALGSPPRSSGLVNRDIPLPLPQQDTTPRDQRKPSFSSPPQFAAPVLNSRHSSVSPTSWDAHLPLPQPPAKPAVKQLPKPPTKPSVAKSTGPPAPAKSTGPPAPAKSTGPPISAKFSGPPAPAKSTGPPISAKFSGPPAPAKSTGPPISAKFSGPPAPAKSTGPPAPDKSTGPPASAKSSGVPAPAKKPKPVLKSKLSSNSLLGSTLLAHQDHACVSEPSSPRPTRQGCPPSGLVSAGHHGSIDSLSDRSSVTDLASRLNIRASPDRLHHDRSSKAQPSRQEQMTALPSVPTRTASNAPGKSPRHESGYHDDGPEGMDRGESPYPSNSRGPSPLHKPPRVIKSASPDSAKGPSRESPENTSEPYDDVVVVTPHPPGAGPIRPLHIPDSEEPYDEMCYDTVGMLPEANQSKSEVAARRDNFQKRKVDRMGPRSSHMSPGHSTSEYQPPDVGSMASDEYTCLHDTWTDDMPGESMTDSFYEMEPDYFDECGSTYEAPIDCDQGPQEEKSFSGMSHLDVQCRAATMHASKGYLEEASSGLPPPGEPPSELLDSQRDLCEDDLYSDDGRVLYQGFMKTGLDAVRFGKIPPCIQSRCRRLAGSGMDTSAERQFQLIQVVIMHEEVYNYTLRQLVDRFINARELSTNLPEDLRVVSKPDAKALFNNTLALLDASTRMLSALKRRQQAHGSSIESVSDIFHFMLSDCLSKLYLTYCTNYVYQIRKLEELSKDNSQFSRSIAILEMDKALGGEDLSSFLSVPISYITYLPKYLQALTENLSAQVSVMEVKAADTAKNVGRWCDEAAQTVYRTEQLVRTEHNLEFAKVKHIALVSQSRRLIRSSPIKLLDVSNPAALHRQDVHLLVFNDLVMLAKPRGLKSAVLRRNDKTLKVMDWTDRRHVDIETDEAELLDFPDQEKTLRGGLMNLRHTVRKEAALDTDLAFKLVWQSDSGVREYLLEAQNHSDRERWMTALDDEASRKGRAVEAIYEDAEMTHYEVVADHMAIEPDELSLTLGTTVVVRRKTPDGWCFGEDLLTGRVGWFQMMFCRPT